MGKSHPIPVIDRGILSSAEKANIRSNDKLVLSLLQSFEISNTSC
jgi:hypothetical protein